MKIERVTQENLALALKFKSNFFQMKVAKLIWKILQWGNVRINILRCVLGLDL